MRSGELSPIRTGVIHTLKVADKQAVIILIAPVRAGNDNEYMVRFDGPHWDTWSTASHKRFKTLDAAKLYATRVLFGGQ
jgi:hypothetical protein